MLKLLDGPAQGDYRAKGAPVYLRAVMNDNGDRNVLALAQDRPFPDDVIWVYKRQGEVGAVHLDSGYGWPSGLYATAVYRYLSDVDGEELRHAATWSDWCIAQS